MKRIANIITVSRILCSLLLVWTRPLSTAFYMLYLYCGLSDAVDGYIARRTKTESRLGQKLDSAADLVFFAALLIALLPILQLTTPALLFIGTVVVIRVSSIIIAFVKYKTFASLHTYANKLTGFLLFAVPLLLAFVPLATLTTIVCSIALASALEELVIHLFSKELNANRASLFIKDKGNGN